MGNDWITLPLSASRITSFCGLRPPRTAAGARGPWPRQSVVPPAPLATVTDLQRAGIDRHHFILVFNVVVNRSLAIGDRELRTTAQGMLFTTVPFAGSMTVALLASPLNTKNVLRRRIVDNGVGVFLALHLACRFQTRHIEMTVLAARRR